MKTRHSTKRATARVTAIVAGLILALGFAVLLALNLPGQMSYDSVSQLLDARTGAYNSWHPAVMTWLMGLFDAVTPGTTLYVVFEACLPALAFALSLRRDAGWGPALVALLTVLTPQFLLIQGTGLERRVVRRCLCSSFRAFGGSGARFTTLAAHCLLPGADAGGAGAPKRVVLLPVGVLALGWATARSDAGRGMRHAVAAFMLLAALFAGATALLAQRGDHGEGLGGEVQLAQIYDPTGAVKQGFVLTRLSRSDPALAQAISTDGVKAYSLQMQDTLEPFLPSRIAKRAVMDEWQALLVASRGLYLRDRLALFWQVLATPDLALCHPAYAGIEGAPQLKALGLSARIRPQDIRPAAYARNFIGTPVLSHLAFAALAAALLLIYLRRGHPSDIAMAGMLAGTLFFAASFFFVSVACDYRYLYPPDLAAMLALFDFFASLTRQ